MKFVGHCLLAAIALFAVSCVSPGTAGYKQCELKTWGMPGTRSFTVQLKARTLLVEVLEHNKRISTVSLRIEATEESELLRLWKLAAQAPRNEDEWVGRFDGTTMALSVEPRGAGPKVAISYKVGPEKPKAARQLLDAINEIIEQQLHIH